MRLGSILWGAIGMGLMALAPVPTSALPSQQVLDDAGLGPMANWTLIMDSADSGTASLWGIGGNGYFALGGDVEIVLKSSAWDHAFGTVFPDGNPCCAGGTTIIADPSGGGRPTWTPSGGPFAFSLLNLTGDLSGEHITSDGYSSDPRLDLAIYRSVLDPSRFAFFFDDGGGPVEMTTTRTIWRSY